MSGYGGDENPDNMSSAQLINRGKEVQQDSKMRLDRSKMQIAATQELAVNTAAELHQQTEQMGNIHRDVDQVESSLKRADIELRRFIRRMATDKIILFFLLLIVLGVVFMIVWKATHKDSDLQTPSELQDFNKPGEGDNDDSRRRMLADVAALAKAVAQTRR